MSEPSREDMIEALRWQVRKLESFAQGRAAEAYSGDLEIFRAILRELEAGGWRPISEYPRDHDPAPDTYWGPNVLLFVPTGVVAPSSDYRIVTGRLEADMWLGWSTDDSMYDIEGEPSHFHRLPTPPSARDGNEA